MRPRPFFYSTSVILMLACVIASSSADEARFTPRPSVANELYTLAQLAVQNTPDSLLLHNEENDRPNLYVRGSTETVECVRWLMQYRPLHTAIVRSKLVMDWFALPFVEPSENAEAIHQRRFERICSALYGSSSISEEPDFGRSLRFVGERKLGLIEVCDAPENMPRIASMVRAMRRPTGARLRMPRGTGSPCTGVLSTASNRTAKTLKRAVQDQA